jgi:hypothetical protein
MRLESRSPSFFPRLAILRVNDCVIPISPVIRADLTKLLGLNHLRHVSIESNLIAYLESVEMFGCPVPRGNPADAPSPEAARQRIVR